MNSKVVTEALLPTISQTLKFNAGDIERLPVVLSRQYEDHVNRITEECIKISKADWDSFETSWDFEQHPLI